MTPKQFAKFMERDHGCLHCGETEAVAPNHRGNRGMGGSKLRDVPSNIIVLCSAMNSLIESDSGQADIARGFGWKLGTWQNPLLEPVYDTLTGQWWVLDDKFGRIVFEKEG